MRRSCSAVKEPSPRSILAEPPLGEPDPHGELLLGHAAALPERANAAGHRLAEGIQLLRWLDGDHIAVAVA
jgi:hypothetical protein